VTAAAGIALRTRNLRFAYPDGTRALDGVDLAIGAGERVALVGQNGSGKSTLVRHFNGLLRASEGIVEVGGEPVADRHVADLARLVGIAFQDPDRQIFAASVAAEVAFGPRNLGVPGAEVDERVAAALSGVGLQARAATNPYDLGYSERKLLGLAAILAMRTPAVVLDEPTTGQDAAGVARVRSIVGELSAAGRTVVAISHDMRFVAETFERVVVLRAGRVIGDGVPDEVFAEPSWDALSSTFLEPPLAARIAAREGIGPLATEAALVDALVRRGRR
jgi:energy-coupling factor transport system ATP-binding protein